MTTGCGARSRYVTSPQLGHCGRFTTTCRCVCSEIVSSDNTAPWSALSPVTIHFANSIAASERLMSIDAGSVGSAAEGVPVGGGAAGELRRRFFDVTAALEQHERRVRFGRIELRRELVGDFVGRARAVDARDNARVTASGEREIPPLRNQQHA